MVSIVVPVYNVQMYLPDCLASILKQTYEEFELLLVDDGSTDGSGKICEQYAALDHRIQVIHQPNGGLSAARNTGMKAAKGEFICFIDSDDLVHKDYLKTLCEVQKQYNSDVVWCQFERFSEHPDINPKPDYSSCQKSRRTVWFLLAQTGKNSKGVEAVVAWNKLIRTRIVKELQFPEGLWHEDEFFITELVSKAETFAVSSAVLYYYRQRTNSITGSDHAEDPRHRVMVQVFERRIKVCKQEKSFRLYRKMIHAYRQTIAIQYYHTRDSDLKREFKRKILFSLICHPLCMERTWTDYLIFLRNPQKYYRKVWKIS